MKYIKIWFSDSALAHEYCVDDGFTNFGFADAEDVIMKRFAEDGVTVDAMTLADENGVDLGSVSAEWSVKIVKV